MKSESHYFKSQIGTFPEKGWGENIQKYFELLNFFE